MLALRWRSILAPRGLFPGLHNKTVYFYGVSRIASFAGFKFLTSGRAQTLVTVNLIRLGLPRIISLLINSKSIGLELNYICKIP